MSRITTDNYEAFVLDYFEGNLSGEDLAELRAFVFAHPELEIDLEDKELIYFPESKVAFDFKENLKKTEEDLVDEQLLLYLEGLMSAEEQTAFEKLLAENKSLAQQLEQYRKTILEADVSEVFDAKTTLLKTEDDRIINNPVISYVEKQMSAVEEKAFEKQLAMNSELRKEFILVSKTRLEADKTIIYPDKSELKKEGKVIGLFVYRRVMAVAAALLLLLGLVVILNYYSKSEIQATQMANHNPEGSKGSEKTAVTTNDSLLPLPGPQLKIVPENNPLAQSENTRVSPKEKKVNKSEVKDQFQLVENENNKGSISNEKKTPEIPRLPEVMKEKEFDDSQLAINTPNTTKPDSSVNNSDYVVALAYESENEDIENSMREEEGKGLWKRAVKVARQANKLGVKSIDGQENSGNKYRLSFNSFSVEKK